MDAVACTLQAKTDYRDIVHLIVILLEVSEPAKYLLALMGKGFGMEVAKHCDESSVTKSQTFFTTKLIGEPVRFHIKTIPALEIHDMCVEAVINIGIFISQTLLVAFDSSYVTVGRTKQTDIGP